MRFNSRARGFLYSELAKFTRAGFGIDKACESLISQPGIDSAKRAFCEEVLNGLRSGDTIAGSLRNARRGPAISEMEISLIDAAERGGVLELGFQHLAEHFRQETVARRRMIKALIYPVILLHMALAVGIGITALLNNVGPNAEPGAGMALVKKGLFWVAIGYGFAVILILVFRALARAAATSPGADRLFRRIPLFGSARKNQALARFCEVFRISLIAGLKMSDAWSGAGRASHSGVILSSSEKGASRLSAGESLGNVILTSGDAFPGDMARSFATADEAGQLDDDAAHWAELFREATSESMERLAEWAPRFFYWFVLGIAAWMVIRVALSYRDLIEGFIDF